MAVISRTFLRTAPLFLATGATLFLLAPSSARAGDAPWLAAAQAKLPPGLVAGRVIRLDEAGLTAAIAVFPAGADNPATPGSAFAPAQVLEVTLVNRDGTLAVAAVRLRPRATGERATDDEAEETQSEVFEALDAERKRAPGIEPCRLSGWAMDNGRTGIAVRAAPSASAKVVGRLAPMRRTPESDQGSQDGWRVEFEITGYKDGWFRITHATPPGAPYGDPPPKRYPKTYAGTGWIRTAEAGGAYANGQMPVRRLLQAPHVDAGEMAPGAPAAEGEAPPSVGDPVARLHACSATWGLTTSSDGRRGWWRGICSNQVTNCS